MFGDIKTKFGKYFKMDSMVVTVLLPLISLLVGVIYCNSIGLSLQDTIIISLLLMIFLSLIEFNVKSQVTAKKLFENDKGLEIKIDELKLLAEIQEKLFKLKHPYFREWAFLRLERFLEENQQFFDGTNKTNPHAEDTFGVNGITYTENYGNLKCLSSVDDYWEDSFTREYLRTQEELIKSKKVKIQRIFTIDRNSFLKLRDMMEKQYNAGIEVYYIFKDNEYIDSSWLKEDYLIQDDKLLVQIFCESHKFNEKDEYTEIITLNKSIVDKKIKRFLRMLERSERFIPGKIVEVENTEGLSAGML